MLGIGTGLVSPGGFCLGLEGPDLPEPPALMEVAGTKQPVLVLMSGTCPVDTSTAL